MDARIVTVCNRYIFALLYYSFTHYISLKHTEKEYQKAMNGLWIFDPSQLLSDSRIFEWDHFLDIFMLIFALMSNSKQNTNVDFTFPW